MVTSDAAFDPEPVDSTVTPDLLALENQVCFALVVASRSVLSLYRPVLEPLGLTHPQYLVMLALWSQDERSAGDLATTLALEPATLSPLLKRLETAGLVSRRRSEADERVLVVSLTESGRDLRRQAESIPQQIVAQLGMAMDELASLRSSLHAVTAAAAASPTP
ncbi:MarR family transcriptional regulator [Labedella phragmitis]|uniref:MarR family transcriptional regulator n=1 Tax=Labedella phragmitis TaxID=2498849 RepID=A0A3S4DJH5_9MICO|nr:MarR family transcriptional regulator [Labedella phragmitis]RWZ52904.1 MarR family transcriptional regulator [Labedella phragmitis]